MRITEARFAHYRIPREVWWPLPLGDTTHQVSHFELLTCDLSTDEGVPGFGYTYTVGQGGTAVATMLREEIAPQLSGVDCRDTQALWERLWWRLHWVGRGGVLPVAMSAVDIAMWDAQARAAGLPLYRYLGATREAIRAYGSGVDLAYSLEELVQEVRDYRAAGFDAVKIKVGRPLAEDLERLRAVREAIGPDCELMVDANMGWDLGEAARRARAMEEFDLSWLEEPLEPEDVDGHARLQAQTAIPIAAGETLMSPYEFRNYFAAGAIRVVQADVTRMGGITPWLRVAQMAEAAHLKLAPHFVQDLHLHLLCAIPNALILEYLPWLDRLLETPLRLEGGVARPPQEPGHGVRFSEEVIGPHRVS